MKLFFEEHVKFLVPYIPGHTCIEVAEEFSKKYFPVTPKQIHDFKCNRKIKSGTMRCSPKGKSKLFTTEIREFIFANNKGNSLAKITALVNEKFGTEFTESQLKNFRQRNHLKSGLTGQFERGCISPNKGKKGWYAPGSEKGWFRKGSVPWNKHSVGSEIIDSYGYIKVKVSEPDVWEFKHKMVWEKHNGRVPDGCVITFKDGDHRNCSIENLMCISFRENSQLNGRKLRTVSPELTEAGLALVRLENRVNELMEERKK